MREPELRGTAAGRSQRRPAAITNPPRAPWLTFGHDRVPSVPEVGREEPHVAEPQPRQCYKAHVVVQFASEPRTCGGEHVAVTCAHGRERELSHVLCIHGNARV